jgi:hypothetical protein
VKSGDEARKAEIMVRIEEIPLEIRWRLASKILTYLPFAYDRTFRELVGDAYNPLVRGIYKVIAEDSRAIAEAFDMPMNNATDIAETLGVVSAILYGPGFETERLEARGEKAVLRITACPMIRLAGEMDLDVENAFNGCAAYFSSLVEDLNPEYVLRYSGGACLGDAYCEMTIEKKEETPDVIAFDRTPLF